MSEYTFDHDSGSLALDFSNTSEWHASEKPSEHLHNFADLVDWGEEFLLLPAHEARRLRQSASEQPEQAAQSYEHAIQLREALFAIFSSRYRGRPIPEPALTLLNEMVRRAMAHLQLVPVGGELNWKWAPEVEGVNLILWPVARAAAELLTSEKSGRVRECDDDRGCGWLFIDQSKNRSRRWCSMESCGNRAKARRHYARRESPEGIRAHSSS